MGGFTASIAIAAMAVSSLALTAIFLVASGLSGWYEERARRVRGAVRRGARLRAGFGAICGTARPLDGRGGGRLATSTRTQLELRTPLATDGVQWRDQGHVTRGDPFVLALESGEEIEVDPEGARLEGLATYVSAPSLAGGDRRREVVMRLSTGDVVWATGVLSRREAPRAGAYRSAVARRRLRAPRRGQVEITTESPLPRWKGLAAAHREGALIAVILGALLHGVVYRRVDVALVRRDTAACDAILGDRRYLPLLEISGVLALAAAAAGWHNRVSRARDRSAESR